jgi:short-subunit dehydrogenase
MGLEDYQVMNKNIQNKVVIITGASSGIGKALAYTFAKQRARLVIAARNIEVLQAMVSEISGYGIEIIAVKTDVSVENDCKNLINEAINRFGTIDVLICNAGISMRALFADLDLKVIHQLMDVNFWGTVYCTKYALPYLLESKGSLAGIISVAGHIGLPGRTGYSASKFAVRGFLESLRTENLKAGLHVMIVAPGFTASNIRNIALNADGNPQGESPRDEKSMMKAEEVAEKILKGVIKRKNNMVLTFKEGKLIVLINKLFPALSRKLAFNHMAKEPDSPFS